MVLFGVEENFVVLRCWLFELGCIMEKVGGKECGKKGG